MDSHWDDYRYSEEARSHNLKIIWMCSDCKREREDYPGMNEGGSCECGGKFEEIGESYEG